MSKQLRPRRALGRGQVRVIVAHARRAPVVSLACCARILQASIARRAWRHSSLALNVTSGCLFYALPRPSRFCQAAELPIVQPDMRHSTDVRTAPGAQVDPVRPRRITEGTVWFRNVLVRARRMCLGPSVHHHRRSRAQLVATRAQFGRRVGSYSPRLLVAGWLCYRRYCAIGATETLSA